MMEYCCARKLPLRICNTRYGEYSDSIQDYGSFPVTFTNIIGHWVYTQMQWLQPLKNIQLINKKQHD